MGTVINMSRRAPREPLEQGITEWLDELTRRYNFSAPFLEEFEQRAVELVRRALLVGAWDIDMSAWPEVQALPPDVLKAIHPLIDRAVTEAHMLGLAHGLLRCALPEAFEHVSTMFGTPPRRDPPDDPRAA